MSKELITQIDAILSILEAKLPASLSNPDNLKLESALKNSLSLYFQGIEKAFPYYILPKLYDKLVAKESIGPAPIFSGSDWDWLENLLKTFSGGLAYQLNAYLSQFYLQGSMQMLSYGETKLGIPIVGEGPPIRAAIEWAEQHCAQLVTQMDDNSKDSLAKIISDGIDNKRGVEGISKDIRAEFQDMSKTRADMIAQTESNNALSSAAMDRMHDMGIEGKEWIAADAEPCEECEGNAAEGVIPIDQPFSSGDMQPAAHPRCRCSLAPAHFPESD